MIIFIIIVVFIIIAIVVAVGEGKSQAEIAEMDNKEKNLPDFTISNKVREISNKWEVAVDAERRKFCYFTQNESPVFYSFDDVISFELVANGKSVSTKSVSDSIGGALLGGFLAGEAGAIIGGTSGKVSTANGFTTLLVKVRLRNIEKPSLTLDILGGVPADPDVADFLLNMAHQVVDLFTFIIDDVNRHNPQQAPAVEEHKPASIADELEKLSNLKATGVITDTEFTELKTKLLSKM